MKTIKHFRVEVTDKTSSGILGDAQKFEVKELNVIGENENYIAVDDAYFTSIRKKSCDWDTCIDKPAIHLYANDTVWGNRITYSLYTEVNKRASTIKKEIENAIAKKYGFFAKGIDLSFIVDREVA